MCEITIVRGDRNFQLNFTIYDLDNKPIDLTGIQSIIFRFKNYENGMVYELSGQVVGDPVNGQVAFHVGDTFVNLLGEFKAEIELTYSNGQILTAPNITVRVIPDIR